MTEQARDIGPAAAAEGAPTPTMLRTLLRERNLYSYKMFKRAYEKAARSLDSSLAGLYPTDRTFKRWVSGRVKGLPRPEHCAVLEAMFPGWSASEFFQPYTVPDDDQDATLLRKLLRQQHLQTYRAFRQTYDDVARRVNSMLVGTYPTERQYYRWVCDDMIGLPHSDHCDVLEAMFPGYTTQQLFEPYELIKGTNPADVERVFSINQRKDEDAFQPGLSQALAILEELEGSDAGPVSDAPVDDMDATADQPANDDILRREVLASSLAIGLSIVLPTPAAGRRVGSDLIEQLHLRNARLRRIDDFLGGAYTYRLYKIELDSAVKFFRECSYTESTGQALLIVIAERAQQAGWAAFDAGNGRLAKRLFKLALSAAQAAKNSSLAGNSLAFLAYQVVSAGRAGTDIAAASCNVAGADAPGIVQALLFERLAWAHAKAQQLNETERALAQAIEVFNRESTQPQPDWASWVDDRELKIMTGRCWAELHRPLRAVEPLESALADFDDTHARDKALYLSWLADAYLDGGEVEQSATTIGRAMDLSIGTGSVRPQQRISAFVERIKPHRKLGSVAEVLDRATQQSNGQSA